MLLTAGVICCFLLPGIPIASRILFASKREDAVSAIVLTTTISLLISGLLGLSLAVAGVFTPVNFWLSMLLIGALTFPLGCYRMNWATLRSESPKLLLYLAIVLGLGWLFFAHPSIWLTYYNYDTGRYSNNASFILQTGGLLAPDLLQSLSAPLRFSDIDYPRYYGAMETPTESFLLPHLHLYPVLLAIFRAQTGLASSFALNWPLALLSCSLFFLIVRRLTGSMPVALMTAVLLFTCAPEQLYAFRIMTEIVTQLFLFSFLYFLIVAENSGSKAAACISALSIVALSVCRLEFAVFYSALPLCFILFRPGMEASHRKTLTHIVYLLLAALPFIEVYYALHADDYFLRNTWYRIAEISEFFGVDYKQYLYPWSHQLITGTNAAILVWTVFLLRTEPKRLLPARLTKLHSEHWLTMEPKVGVGPNMGSNIWPILGAAAFAAFIGWNLFVRPIAYLTGTVSADLNVKHDTINLIRFIYFIDPLTVLAAIGSFFAIRRRPSAIPYWALMLAAFCILILRGHHTDHPMWWIRRYLPIAIPALYFALAFVLLERGKLMRALLFGLPLLFNLTWRIQNDRIFHENPEALSRFAQLAQRFPEGTVQLCFDAASCSHSAVVLHSHYNVPTAYLSTGLNERKIKLIRQLLTAGHRIVVTHSGFGSSPFSISDQNLLAAGGIAATEVETGNFYQEDFRSFTYAVTQAEPPWLLFRPAGFLGTIARIIYFRVNLVELSPVQSLPVPAPPLHQPPLPPS